MKAHKGEHDLFNYIFGFCHSHSFANLVDIPKCIPCLLQISAFLQVRNKIANTNIS